MAQVLQKSQSELARKAKLLRLAAVSLAESMRNGNFKSIYRGQGIEFSDIREYLSGDNVRTIDWNVTARMGRTYVKLYDEDSELSIFFILDRSLSMYSGTNGRSRLETASEAASLLVLAGELNDSSLGAVFFDGEVRFSCSPKSGRDRSMLILSKLNQHEESITPGSVLENAITGASKILKKRSLIFVLSDFRTSGWETSLARLAQKNDVIAVRISDPMDSELPSVGTIDFIDPETGWHAKLPTSSDSFSREWFDAFRKRTDSFDTFCARHNIFNLNLSTQDDPARVLSKFFAERGRRQ